MDPHLRLTVAAADLAPARDALLAMAGSPRPSRSRSTATFYDTEDHALRRRGLTLQVRRSGRNYVQNLIRESGAAVDAGDWVDTIRGPRPDPSAPQFQSEIGGDVAVGDLHPLFAVGVERSSFRLSPNEDAEMEVAIDRGEIRAIGGATAQIHLIDLAMKRGDGVALWDVALRLLELVACRIEPEGAAGQGFRLLSPDEKPVARNGLTIALDADMTFDAALQQIGRGLIESLLRNESHALAGHPEGIHQMRISVRRLRSLLSAVRAMLPKDHYAWANGVLRWLGSALGPVRNLDVFDHTLLKPVSGALKGERDLARLAAAARRRRKTAHDRAREAIASQRYTASIMRLARWFEARSWRDQPVTEKSARLVGPLADVAPGLLRRLYRKARRRAKNFPDLGPPQRHKLRIALKQLRYATEFLDGIYDEDKVERFVSRVKPLQDDLGYASDVRSAKALVAELGNGHALLERAGGIVIGWHDRGLAEAEQRMLKHVRRFRDDKPFW
jgi:triphosphatase